MTREERAPGQAPRSAPADPGLLDRLADASWPALARYDVAGWTVRLAHGVTSRANSVLPLSEPDDVDQALRRVERRYAEHRAVPRFHLSPAARPAGLDALLTARGYDRLADVDVLVADVDEALGLLDAIDLPGPRPAAGQAVGSSREPVGVAVTGWPDRSWLELWSSVDGRGDARWRRVVEQVMTGAPARYVAVADRRGLAATSRLTVSGEWAGLTCMAVRPDARGRGLGRAALRAVLHEARRHGARRSWLQVLASNAAALGLYRSAGYARAYGYHYRCLEPAGRGAGAGAARGGETSALPSGHG